MFLKEKIRNFFLDESGQTMTEYVLILAIVATIFMNFRKKFIGILKNIFTGLEDKTSDVFDDDDW